MTTIKKNISLFLAIVFVLSSLGFSINKMVCLKSGKVKFSFIQAKDCCPKKKSSGPVIKTKCCDHYTTSFHLNDFSSSSKSIVPSAIDCFLPIKIGTYTPLNFDNQPSKLFFADLPPPFYGRQLLSFISILLI